MSVEEFALPDLGEGLTESEVVAWRVAVGDTVELNQIIAEVETAKALVEVPSPFAGVVRELHAEPGETLRVGAPLLSVELDGDTAEPGSTHAVEPESKDVPEPESTDAPEHNSTDAPEPVSEDVRVLEPVSAGIGIGGRADLGADLPGAAAAAAPSASVPSGDAPARPVVSHDDGRPRVRGESAGDVRRAEAASTAAGAAGAAGGAGGAGSVKSAPAASGEERHEVLVGRGPREQSTQRPRRRPRSGRLSEPVGWQRPIGFGPTAGGAAAPWRPVEEAGTESSARTSTRSSMQVPAETRVPATGVRRRTAEAMVRSAATPQVTEFLTVDVTRSIRLLDRLGAAPEFRDKRVTVLTLAAKALCRALAATPEANARWDDAAYEIVTPAAVNLGIAVATERGLVVPNIRSADTLRMPELADALTALVERARGGRSTPAELTGGTITITNVGVFGVDAGTPLLNPGETAILALGAVNRRPWEHKERVALRHVMTLSLTFDHRVIDGEQGSRLLRDVGRRLSDPASAVALA